MCGLVGMAGKIDHQMKKKMFPLMMRVCSARGLDSAGAINVNEQTWRATGAKQIGAPDYLLDSRFYQMQVENPPAAALLGHCRSRTVGNATDPKNAHPFEFENVIGMHNGTLRAYNSLPGYKDFDVDSEVLYHAINEMGIEEAMAQVSGAWALTYYDKKEQTLNFLRNKERTLYLMWSKDKKTMFWASEPWMLGAVARSIEPLPLSVTDEDGKEIGTKDCMLLPEDTLWTFKFKMDGAYGAITGKSVKEVKGKEVVVTGNFSNGCSGVAMGNQHLPTQNKTGGTNRGGNSRILERDPKTGQWVERGGAGAGDSVNDPFQSQVSKKHTPTGGGSSGSSSAGVKGSLPGLPTPTPPTPEGKTNTANSERTRQILSINSSGTRQGHQSSSTKLMSSTSLSESKSIVTSPSNSNESCSGEANASLKSSLGNKTYRHIAIRTVAGIPYITCNHTHVERSVYEFEKATGGICCFCEEPIGDLSQVYEILTPEQFICTGCTTDAVIAGGRRNIKE